MKKIITTAIVLGVSFGAFAANAAPTDDAMFTVTKGGEPIGSHSFKFSNAGGVLKVDAVTHTDVKVLFMRFKYDHERTEIWKGGRLQSLTSKTNDDGKAHKANMKANGTKLNIKADGKDFTLAGDSMVVTLWNKDILDKSLLYSALDGQAYKVKIEPKGSEEITIGGRKIKASVYQMNGDLVRKLWYGPDGTFLKTAFKRKGYDIEWVRN